ncbi:MAG: hypothetical protein ACE5G0_03290 [Rhodothermales bacterium]
MAEKSGKEARQPEAVSKKDQIISLFLSGVGEVEDLAMLTGTRPTYVASVLRDENLRQDYFDLYTSTVHPMNVYSKFFAGKLGFKNVETAQRSVALIDQHYHHFDVAQDRAGQHHALVMALTMFNRARWTGKRHEAEVYRRWLVAQLGVRIPQGDEEEGDG